MNSLLFSFLLLDSSPSRRSDLLFRDALLSLQKCCPSSIQCQNAFERGGQHEMISPHSIHYWLALEKEVPNQFSPFQGFSPALLKRQSVIRQILRFLPPNVYELYAPSIGSLQARLSGVGPYLIHPLVATEFQYLPLPPPTPFHVIFTSNTTHSVIEEWRARTAHPILLVDTNETPQFEPMLSRPALLKYCDTVLDYLKHAEPDFELPGISRARQTGDPTDRLNAGIEFYGHNSTIPNELALLSVGCNIETTHPALCGEDAAYVRAILRSASALAKLRSVIPPSEIYDESPPLNSLVVTTPGLLKDVREQRRPANCKDRDFFDALRLLQTQDTYAFTGDAESLQKVTDNPVFGAVIQTRTAELSMFTDAIAARAASYLSPVLRLPPSLERLTGEVVHLADAIRADSLRPRGKPLTAC